MKGTVIGICGDIGSGKNAVADYLVERYGFKLFSWATELKEWTHNLVGPLGVTRRQLGLDGGTQAEKDEPLTVLRSNDAILLSRPEPERFQGLQDLGDWTGRSLLEYLGTEVARSLHPDVWVEKLVGKIISERCERVVIPDTRFPNEFTAIRALGGSTWRTRLLVDHDKECFARTLWRNPCSCGAIEATGHSSDLVWRGLDVAVVLAAPKPGVRTLCRMVDAFMLGSGYGPKVLSRDINWDSYE